MSESIQYSHTPSSTQIWAHNGSLALSCRQSRRQCWAPRKGLTVLRGRGPEVSLGETAHPPYACQARLCLLLPEVELTFAPWGGWGRSEQATEITCKGSRRQDSGPESEDRAMGTKPEGLLVSLLRTSIGNEGLQSQGREEAAAWWVGRGWRQTWARWEQREQPVTSRQTVVGDASQGPDPTRAARVVPGPVTSLELK